MSKLLHGVLQGIAIVVQYGAVASGYIPMKYQPLAAAVIAVAQAILALSQHKAG